MPLTDNPYQPPAIERTNKTASVQESRLWWYVFWAACCSAATGTLAFFSSTAPPLGFFLVSLVLFGSTAVFTKTFRRLSIIGIIVLFALSTAEIRQLRSMRTQALKRRALIRERDRLQEMVRQAAAQLEQQSEKNGSQS